MRVMKMFVVMAGVLLVAVLPSMAAEKGKAEPYTVVTSDELKAMLDRQEPDTVIIDSWYLLSESFYHGGRFGLRFSRSSKTILMKKISSSLAFLLKYFLPQLITDSSMGSSVTLRGFFLLSGSAPRNVSPFIASRK